MASPQFVSDREQEILDAVSNLAIRNPFEPERIENEKRALGEAFVKSSEVWHMDADLLGINPNIASLSELVEGFAEALRGRLKQGARATPTQLTQYEGLVFYLLFYRYAGSMTEMIEAVEEGRAESFKFHPYAEYCRDFGHFFSLKGVEFPIAPDTDKTLALGFQIRRAFHHTFLQIFGGSLPIASLRAAVWRSIFTHDLSRYRRALIDKMADISTLVLGESGTGKELVARAISMSRYIPFDSKRQVFVEDYSKSYRAVNLSALSSTLIESELFGHKKGAFTGATQDREGWLESCGSNGTVFLDEIGELDPAIQVKLLRVLQSRVFQRIGETRDRPFSGKIVAATNRDLEAELSRGGFREDLYYRLCADVIRMPTLREQLADSPQELESLVHVIAKRMVAEEADGLTRDTVQFIRRHLPDAYAWPGNVRELEQCVRSILVQGRYRTPRRDPPAGDAGIAPALLRGEATADELLREYVTRIYVRAGSYEEAARILQLDRRTVKAKVDPELAAELRDASRS